MLKKFFKMLRCRRIENKKVIIGSLKVLTRNLGDCIQLIAMQELLKKRGLIPELYIDRDHEIANSSQLNNVKGRVFLVINGWFKRNGKQWPPHPQKILPLFYGFHIRLKACPELISNKALKYYKQHEPIGCRDIYTADLLKKHGIDAFVSNCLSLTFPKRQIKSNPKKIFFVSKYKEILNYIPKEIADKSEYISHYSGKRDFEYNMKMAKKPALEISE